MDKSKTFYLNRNYSRSIRFSISGWRQNPSIYLRIDGGEREVTFHIGCFIGIWITLERMWVKSWYPEYWSNYTKSFLPTETEFSIRFHGWNLWWTFFVTEEQSEKLHFWDPFRKNFGKGHSWRYAAIDFDRLIRGKHSMSKTLLIQEDHLLPFFEGSYPVRVFKYERTDSWTRWFKRKMITFEVHVLKYVDGVLVDGGMVPHEGKGENSWDCGEDGTYSSSFPDDWMIFGGRKITTCYKAALKFWVSCMIDRERYGSKKWVPQKFKNEEIKMAV